MQQIVSFFGLYTHCIRSKEKLSDSGGRQHQHGSNGGSDAHDARAPVASAGKTVAGRGISNPAPQYTSICRAAIVVFIGVSGIQCSSTAAAKICAAGSAKGIPTVYKLRAVIFNLLLGTRHLRVARLGHDQSDQGEANEELHADAAWQ